mmetsp:Transcript_28510/g.86069  ORF Transcript_28510/g.86069 Transcript_28510/m.86069 type:complete len:448 (+) Transcript_28510:307-1650(+)
MIVRHAQIFTLGTGSLVASTRSGTNKRSIWSAVMTPATTGSVCKVVMRLTYPALWEYCSITLGSKCSAVHWEPNVSAISFNCWVAEKRTACTESLRLERTRGSSLDWNMSTPNKRASLGTCSTTLWRMRQWLSLPRFWTMGRSAGTKPSIDSTSQIRPALETMAKRTSWNSSFIRSEKRPSSCCCVASRPKTLATGPKTWARAARTGCAESDPSVCNDGRMYVCICSAFSGVDRCKQGSITRTASFRTSCSGSFIISTRCSRKGEATNWGPKAAQSWSKTFATVRRTRQERSLHASLTTPKVYCLFSSGVNMRAKTSVVWTIATRMVSCVASCDNCMYTAIKSAMMSDVSHHRIKSFILWAAARRTIGVSSAHKEVYAFLKPAFWSSLAKRYAVGSKAQAETRAVKKSDVVANLCSTGTTWSGAKLGLRSAMKHREATAWSLMTVSS